LRALLEAIVAPPLVCFLLVAAGWLLRKRKPRLARSLIIGAGALLWLLSTPLVGLALLDTLQSSPALDLARLPPAEAIVVLGADEAQWAPEYGGASLGPMALQRLRYGARLQGASGAPLLVTGGVLSERVGVHGEAMRRILEDEYGVPVRWLEPTARNTWENAVASAGLLREAGVHRVYLVTHAFHMPRARWAFEKCGIEVVPAPTGFVAPAHFELAAMLPSWWGLRGSALAWHEWLGAMVYRLK